MQCVDKESVFTGIPILFKKTFKFGEPNYIFENFKYSIIDQQCKQTIAIDNVRSIVNGDGRVFASTLIDLFALLPISWETQLEKLLADGRIEEALVLAANAHISSNDREQHQRMLKDLEHKVALQRFSSGRFLDAMEMFETCNIDPRKVCLCIAVYFV